MHKQEIKNSILNRLPENELEVVLTKAAHGPMTLRSAAIEPHVPISTVIFPESGFYSVVALVDKNEVEVATVGWEGMVGIPLVLGATSTSQRAFCQMQGSSWRMDAKDFLNLFETLPRFSKLCRRYCLYAFEQAGQNSACNRAHSVTERCAKWFLLSSDGAGSDTFELTQDFLAEMIGVRRQGVNLTAGQLSSAGLIEHDRGRIKILNREGLMSVSCECYALIKKSLSDYFNY